MGLDEYNRKRNFGVTSEPPGDEPSDTRKQRAEKRVYIIQKHAASRLHYDFRLELEGVLKSWSVPKGPSLDPRVKRLAMQTEDHPIDYAKFEGIIPAGEYGGGTVLLWDQGTWEPQGNPYKELAEGNFKFLLNGEKLRGKWALIRLRGRGPAVRGRDDERAWLLIKERDDEARPEADVDITATRPESVVTARTLEEIATDRKRVWHSDRARVDPGQVPGAREAALPARLHPARAARKGAPPDGEGWLHEMEIDGDRLLARLERGEVRLLSDKGTALPAARARELEPLADALRMIPADGAIVDGVVTALYPDGRARKEGLPDALAGKGEAELAFYVDDLPFLDGHDLGAVPLARRKALLAALLGRIRERGPLRYTDHVAGDGAAFYREACRLGIPGMLSRRADAPYPEPSGSRVAVSCAKKAGAPGKADAATEHAGVRLTHPERVLWADVGLTKMDLVRYYETVAPHMLPHVAGRPLSLVRCPDGAPVTPGAKQKCFYMKHSNVSAPVALDRVKIREKTKVGDYLVIRDLAGLVALCQMSVLEIHPWGSTAEELEHPDRIVFDLDPDPSVVWARVVEAALDIRRRLAELELESFVKTTGGKGLHVVAPVEPRASWEEVFEFSRAVAGQVERDAPRAFTTDMSKAVRKGKIFIDFLRNGRGATAVAPYSTRTRPGAPVATPLAWNELTPDLDPTRFTVATIPARLEKLRHDPWAPMLRTKQLLSPLPARRGEG